MAMLNNQMVVPLVLQESLLHARPRLQRPRRLGRHCQVLLTNLMGPLGRNCEHLITNMTW